MWLAGGLTGLEVEGQSASNCVQLPSHHRYFPTYFLSHSQLLWTGLLSFHPSSSSKDQPLQVITIWSKNCTNVNISDQAMKLQTSGLQITINWGFWWSNYHFSPCSISPVHLFHSSHIFYFWIHSFHCRCLAYSHVNLKIPQEGDHKSPGRADCYHETSHLYLPLGLGFVCQLSLNGKYHNANNICCTWEIIKKNMPLFLMMGESKFQVTQLKAMMIVLFF